MLRDPADHSHYAVPFHDLAVSAHLSHTGSDFHGYFSLFVILPLSRSYGDNSIVTVSPGTIRI